MIEVKSTLNGEANVELKKDHLYMIDFSKLNSVNDLILILASMGIGFPSDHPNIGQLKGFLNTDNPIDLKPQPKRAPFIPLDKLDTKQPIEDRIFNKGE